MIVFLHGVPENPDVWAPLRSELSRRGHPSDVFALPGFVNPPPSGFTSTKDEYAAWLVHELERFPEPVHLVSHDWGSPLALWVAANRPELLRSWVADATYMFHPQYRWHTLARIWQNPFLARAFWSSYLHSPVAVVSQPYRRFGLPPAEARALVRMGSRTMANSINRLYRSAVPNIHATWGDLAQASQVPGLIISAAHDTFGSPEHADEVNRKLGATVVHFPDLGHWWALQAPQRSAETLTSFWAALDEDPLAPPTAAGGLT